MRAISSTQDSAISARAMLYSDERYSPASKQLASLERRQILVAHESPNWLGFRMQRYEQF